MMPMPPWSFAGPSRSPRSPHQPTLADALREILIWLRLRRPPPPTTRQIAAEARLIEKLAEELADEDQAQTSQTPTLPATKPSKRQRRM
jgi:hypothetical protein